MNWNMIGHEWAVKHLASQLAAGNLRQAYLIVGPDGVGKRTLALRLAQALLCENGTDEPCFNCGGCERAAAGRHPDLHLIEAEPEDSNLKIDAIRQLQREIVLSPYEAARRIAIVQRAHELSTGAANALLKTLEEPPDRVVVVLTARAPEAVPETVSSRCEVLRLRPVAQSKIDEFLNDAEASGQAALLAALAIGRPGVALAYAEDDQLLEQRQDALQAMVELLADGRKQRFDFAEQASQGRDVSLVRARVTRMLSHWLSFWRDVTLAAAKAKVSTNNPDFADQIDEVQRVLSPSGAAEALSAVQDTLYALSRYANTQLALEALLLRMPYLPAGNRNR